MARYVADITVNEEAYDTWLEPYIGWTFKATRVTRKNVFWLMEIGDRHFRREKKEPIYFDITQSTETR